MKLHLRYNDFVHAPVAAAFIRSADTRIWLQEIDRWKITADELDCYILPQNIQSAMPSGLFVIFKNAGLSKNIDLLEPYTCIGQKLYIPVNTELLPQVSNDELGKLLLWDKQVLHPVIGFIGFEKRDKINLSELFFHNKPVGTDWSFANPGLITRPALTQISIVKQTTEELMQSVKDEIGEKQLNEIPVNPEDEPSVIEKFLDNVKLILLKALLLTASGVKKIIPEGNTVGSGTDYSTNNGPGIFQRIKNWLEKNLDELQKKRNDEIKRLLKLFDEDNDEALRYAIPLNSPYFDRGPKAQASSKLLRRSLDLNFGKLGGGRRVDEWYLGNDHLTLHTKYLNAAKKEIEAKNFRKAAYVYAHLLGDYRSATNVLEQGKMYREAAMLHKEHLNNMLAAAECLERGQLYHEAIELYIDMGRDEKIGDLYQRLEQPEKSEEYYEKHITARISSSDYLDAARVIDGKLHQSDRAKDTLLSGWKSTYQAELCLKNYFDIVIEKDDGKIEKEVKEIYSKHTSAHKKISFLNVLEYINKKKRDKELLITSQDIVYEVVNNETEAGNINALDNLKKFLPGDWLIGSDTSRYAANARNIQRPKTPQVFNLDQSIVWIKAAWHRSQFLVIGTKKGLLHIARCNWYGNIEYYSWDNAIERGTGFTFINSPYYSNTILLCSSKGLPVTRKNLPKDKYFAEKLLVYCPIWMHKKNEPCLINNKGGISLLESNGGSLTMQYYDIDGNLERGVVCIFEDGFFITNAPYHSQMVMSDGYYYTYHEKHLITISEHGAGRGFDLSTGIRLFAASLPYQTFYMLVSTNKGCLLYKPEKGDMSEPGDYFAVDLIPSIIVFIATDKFVIAEKKRIYLFEITGSGPKMIKESSTSNTIIAVLPTNNRYQFATVEEDGKISMFEMEG